MPKKRTPFMVTLDPFYEHEVIRSYIGFCPDYHRFEKS